MNKEYLGDGVYIELDNILRCLILTTENGIEVTNRIILEIQTIFSLCKYLDSKEHF